MFLCGNNTSQRFVLSHIHEEVQINNNIGKAIMLIVIPVNSVTNIIMVLDVSKVSKIGNNEDKLKVNIHSDKKSGNHGTLFYYVGLVVLYESLLMIYDLELLSDHIIIMIIHVGTFGIIKYNQISPIYTTQFIVRVVIDNMTKKDIHII